MSSEGEQILDEIKEDLLMKLSLPENKNVKELLFKNTKTKDRESKSELDGLFYLDSDEFRTNDFAAIPRDATINIVRDYDEAKVGEIKVHIDMDDSWFARDRNKAESYDYSNPIENFNIKSIKIFLSGAYGHSFFFKVNWA